MSYLCFLGAATLSSAVVYHEWKRRNNHQTVSDLIVALEPQHHSAPDDWITVRNAKAIIEWTKRPAESIKPADLEDLLELRTIARQAKRAALRRIVLRCSTNGTKFGYIEQAIAEYKSLKDQATFLIHNVAPQCTLALSKAL